MSGGLAFVDVGVCTVEYRTECARLFGTRTPPLLRFLAPGP